MYNVYDKSSVYFLYDRDKNTTEKIGDINDLILFVADMMRKWYGENSWWYGTDYKYGYYHTHDAWTKHDINIAFRDNLCSNVFNRQNLTGNDGYITYDTVVKTCINEETGESYNSYTHVFKRIIYPYTFYDGNGAVFDIKRIIQEVKVCLLNGFKKESKCKYIPWKYRRRKSHVTYGWGSRRSAGWKDHKDRKQWMHNVRNKNRYEEVVSAKSYWKNYDYEEYTIDDFAEDYEFEEREVI